MKKMSDVFELPVSAYDLVEILTENDSSLRYELSEQEIKAAHAINHVDALAEALDGLLETAWFESSISSEKFENLKNVLNARAALAAYRGEV